MAGTIETARDAFARQAWGDAYALLAASDPVDADDLERLAVAAYLVGRNDESARAWERAHLESARLGDPDRAARNAFWLAFLFMLRGDMGQAGGWRARATRLVEEAGADGSALGYLQVPAGLEALESGDPSTAQVLADDIIDVATRSGDADLLALGVLLRGQASLALGQTAGGMKLLDEVMVAVATGEVSPIPAGIVYCAVIEACMDAFDVRRAAEWTEALDRWCAAQPDLVPYRGQCLVHRSQVLQAHGAWAEAAVEAEHARRRLAEPAHPALGLALYQQGELLRLRGEFSDAERAYRAGSDQGREPAPGLALLRLAEGRADAAVAAVRRMVEEHRGQLTLPTMLAACVEIMVGSGDIDAARADADELAAIAADVDSPLLHAISAYASGATLVAEGEATAALPSLRRAYVEWRDLAMPYDAARARVQIGLACRALGDHDTADFEIAAARATFEQLGARTDLAHVGRLLDREEPPRPTELTDRECEVIRLVAAGKTNREIAAVLVISEHTVGRHLQNIFLKLGLSSRAAATAYAYEQGLV